MWKISACTFFGHRDCPSSIKEKLREAIIEQIEKENISTFYVGNNGNYDAMVRSLLRELQQAYPYIRYFVVLTSPPRTQDFRDFSDTLLPEGIENVPKRFAIHWRNRWMLQRTDHVITHITHSWGGAAKFAETAKRQNKTVVNIIE